MERTGSIEMQLTLQTSYSESQRLRLCDFRHLKSQEAPKDPKTQGWAVQKTPAGWCHPVLSWLNKNHLNIPIGL